MTTIKLLSERADRLGVSPTLNLPSASMGYWLGGEFFLLIEDHKRETVELKLDPKRLRALQRFLKRAWKMPSAEPKPLLQQRDVA